MKRGYVLLAAVLAMVLVPGAAWGAVTVLEDFDDGATKVNVFEWAPITADNVTISEDTPNGEGYSNEILMDAWGGEDDCYFSVLDPTEGANTDLSGWSYLNFYLKASADIDFPIFQCYGNDWDPGLAIWDWEESVSPGLPTEWTYYSFAIPDDFTDDWAWGDPATADQFSAIWQVEWYMIDEAQPTVTVWVDHVTASDTPEEGELGAAAPEVEVSISGPHVLDVGEDLVLEATQEDFDEGETYQWSKDGEDLVGETGDTLTISPADEGDSGTYGVTVEGTAGGESAEASATHQVLVGFAAPLAGGLGLSLLAGACALAGIVAVRRSK